MSELIISADNIFDGYITHHQSQLNIKNGAVVSIDPIDGRANQHVNGFLAPGLIDLQVNGGGGALLNTHRNVEGLDTIFSAHRNFGTSAMLPTLISDTIEVMEQAADAIASAIKQGVDGIIGVHFEGPHLSVEKKGAHSQEHIRQIGEREWDVLSRRDLGKVVVTVAPENVSPQDITRLISLGVQVFLGHSNASFSIAQRALDAGASGFTHLFNAMSAFTSREPGMVGAALLNDQATCGLIVDGHHVDYTSCKLALKNKPAGSLVLVTDAMSVVGTDIERFAFFDREIIRTGDKLNSTTGELAGSALDMVSAVRNSVDYLGVSIEEALRMASLYPAKFLNLSNSRGHLQPGARADMIALDPQLKVTNTWIGGKQ